MLLDGLLGRGFDSRHLHQIIFIMVLSPRGPETDPPVYRPEALLGRISHSLFNLGGHPEIFVDTVHSMGLQDPCPWGDLTNGDCPERLVVPLALEVGSGAESARTHEFMRDFCGIDMQHVIESDRRLALPQRRDAAARVQMDLTDPSQIDLGGLRVHGVYAWNIFTGDGQGVTWPSYEVRRESTRKLLSLLMPRGIFCSGGSIGRSDLDMDVLSEEFGGERFSLEGGISDHAVTLWQIGN